LICNSREVLGNPRTLKEACACEVGQGCVWRSRGSARERVRQRSRVGNDRQYYTRYQYDKTGNLNQHTDAKGQPEQYEHDRLGRLVKIVDAEQGETLLAYDARDNLLSVTDPEGRVTSYRYNRNDQRTAEIKPAAEPASERQYDYDANGNLVEEITPAAAS